MSETNSFLLRWLSLKARSQTATPAAPSADLSTLPSVDSLTATSDISAFLQPGVPADLLREVLRRAWRSDPAIRNFVGIAEMQWDFNDPHAMPGFGELDPAEPGTEIVQLSKAVVDPSDALVPDVTPDANPGRDGQVDPVWTAGGAQMPAPNRSPQLASQTVEVPDPVDAAIRPRRHGSALPKPIK